MSKTKRKVLNSVLALLVCISMFAGSTFAWFSETVSSGNSIITSGNLDVEMYWAEAFEGEDTEWINVEESDLGIFNSDNATNWEPGRTDIKYLKVVNKGDLSLKYQLNFMSMGEMGKLAEVIDVYYAQLANGAVTSPFETRESVLNLTNNMVKAEQTLSNLALNYTTFNTGVILPKDSNESGEIILAIALQMQTTAGNEYQLSDLGDGFGIQVLATQHSHESDSFGNDYDGKVAFPNTFLPVSISQDVTEIMDDYGVLTEQVKISGPYGVNVTLEAGTKLNGTGLVTLTIKEKENSEANVKVSDNEELKAFDVHVEGVASDNEEPMVIKMGKVLPNGLNKGNLSIYHVENGQSKSMSEAATIADFSKHNQFVYEPYDGSLTLYMATFSEVAIVADQTAAWNGNRDYSWYVNTLDGEEKTEYIIANADQLAAFAAIVGGMNEEGTPGKGDNFAGKTVKLVNNVNLGYGVENHTYHMFYPIGYYNNTGSYEKTSGGSVKSSVSSFEGTFNGHGHTISNFYQNTWEMFGDYNDGYSGTPNHYKDAMGLFGYVLNGTVKNLTVNNFSSDGEFTPTGVIVAYVDGDSTFENIAITNCNPRVYNTGNGGIIGIAGDTSAANDDHIILKNITVDNSNKISALWGSWDVACGGLVGMYRGNVDGSGNATGDTIEFENCHVAAQIDVYNDVCANYQYYAYRYSGMIIGSVRHNTTNDEGRTIPNMTGISASGCTVNYGDWNDYYYCEFEKNTMASYSEDYQFSRVSHSELNFNDANGNGVVDAEERASVTGCKHDHTAEENHQAIYLPFHQLFTGYSWGVSSIGLEKYSGIVTDLDITEGEQEKSVQKFEGKVTELDNNKEINIGDIFAYVDKGVEVIANGLTVNVTDLDENNENPISGEFVKNEENWEDGVLKLSGTGKALITIQDYYFCTPTVIEVVVKQREDVEKFETLFKGSFLYRIGNENSVKLSSLFETINDVSIYNSGVKVEFENLDDTRDVAVTFKQSENGWENATLDFDGTGIVKLSISDNDHCIPTELSLEVVNGKNITKIESATDGNKVLLNNVTGGFSVSGEYSIYGNGFTVTLDKSNHSTARGAGYAGYIHMNGGTIDNIIINGPVYLESNIYREQGETGSGADDPVNYFRNNINIDSGDSKILNSYISGARTPIYVKNGGNVLIENTTISGGAYANLELQASKSLTLNNVTTIQKVTKDSYNGTKDVIGIGIVINNENTKVVLNGLKQYNWINQSQWNNMLGEKVDLFPKLFTDSKYEKFLVDDNGTKYINTGIIFAYNISDTPNMEGSIDQYELEKVTLGGKNGAVYTQINNGIVDVNNNYEYLSNSYYSVNPSVEFDFINKNYDEKLGSDDSYCYFDQGAVQIGFEIGQSKLWNPMIMNITKGKETITNYKVIYEGKDYTNKNIEFTTTGEYVVNYEFTDPYNYRKDSDGNIETYDITYKKTIAISVVAFEKAAKNADFKFGVNANNAGVETEKILINNKTFISAKGINDSTLTQSGRFSFTNELGLSTTPTIKYSKKPDVANKEIAWASITINDQKIYFPLVGMGTTDSKFGHTGSWYGCFPVYDGVVQIIDYANKGTGAEEIYDYNDTSLPPNGLTVYKPQNVFVYQGTVSSVPTTPSKVTKGHYKNMLCYTTQTDLSASNERGEVLTLATYTYVDNKGATYYYFVGYYCQASTDESCITPETLITLADGSQVEVQYLTGNEELLVWNLETGKYDKAKIVFIDSDEEAEYEIIHLYFSDGTDVEVIYEHGFFDTDLGEYVYLDRTNAKDYIGHSFVKQDDISKNTWETVELVDVVLENRITRAYSPVTYSHLVYYVDGMLSMPGGIDGLFNIYDVDVDTMKYNAWLKFIDTVRYGQFTYEDFNGMIPEEAFYAFNGKDLKVAIAKGLITWEDIAALAERYVPLMEEK